MGKIIPQAQITLHLARYRDAIATRGTTTRALWFLGRTKNIEERVMYIGLGGLLILILVLWLLGVI